MQQIFAPLREQHRRKNIAAVITQDRVIDGIWKGKLKSIFAYF